MIASDYKLYGNGSLNLLSFMHPFLENRLSPSLCQALCSALERPRKGGKAYSLLPNNFTSRPFLLHLHVENHTRATPVDYLTASLCRPPGSDAFIPEDWVARGHRPLLFPSSGPVRGDFNLGSDDSCITLASQFISFLFHLHGNSHLVHLCRPRKWSYPRPSQPNRSASEITFSFCCCLTTTSWLSSHFRTISSSTSLNSWPLDPSTS